MSKTTFFSMNSSSNSRCLSLELLNNIHSSIFEILLNHPVINSLESMIGYHFVDQELLVQCLSHKSFVNEVRPKYVLHNERLEFLGDAVLGQYITLQLFRKFPDLKEGELSKLKGALVNTGSWAKLALGISLDESILLGKGELKLDQPPKDSILANCFEALIAGVLLDGGQIECERVIEKIIHKFGEDNFYDLSKIVTFDYKTLLQEKTMSLYKSLPIYQSEEIEGNQFLVKLIIENKLIDQCEHNSKKKAEHLLAERTLNNNLLIK
ncbi:MAG: ribonuclease III [Bdellovibrionales bacterium]|jgi:ribonuclease III|nr:ribonuclease III [Bdellovibrionales bacterium]